jgi:hypothetical protein
VMRDGRWVFLDFLGKGNKTRSVAVPLWVKQEIEWRVCSQNTSFQAAVKRLVH